MLFDRVLVESVLYPDDVLILFAPARCCGVEALIALELEDIRFESCGASEFFDDPVGINKEPL